jgi:hypothetical protein
MEIEQPHPGLINFRAVLKMDCSSSFSEANMFIPATRVV